MGSEVWAVAASMLQLRMSRDQFLWLRVNDNEPGRDVKAILTLVANQSVRMGRAERNT